MKPFRFRAGDGPLLVSMPHTGTHLPATLKGRLTPAAQALPDTDWHLEPLYDFLDALGASVLVATHSRYVVDLNRPPDDANLYPGQDTTGLVPVDTFHREAIYLNGEAPQESEVRVRADSCWRPYHDKLQAELERLRSRHGVALLWDAHSIASEVPRFFSGRLPDFNLGTAGGSSCGAGIGEALLGAVEGYSAVLNGRFKGGYITRCYGDPANRIHAVQLELSEATYMEERPPYRLREDLAARVRPQLRRLLEEFLRLGQALGRD
ncbi:MAG TPA: N-formylglutamate deformylase [Burkholderiales bacterium]|nr:N-formylglutamate deformylase [Burkholderiales bacterium]